MAGIDDQGAANITGGKTDFAGKSVTKRMIAADSEHRDRKLALFRKQLLVIDGILRKGRELSAKCVMNRAGPGIERRIMIAGLLVDPGGDG